MEIIKWIPYNETYKYKECECDELHLNFLKNYLYSNNLIIKGGEHQLNKIPVFDDGYLLLSWRRWAEIMAEVVEKMDGKTHNYMEFYT